MKATRRGLIAVTALPLSAVLVPPPAPAPHRDAALLALGAALDVAWQRERLAWAASNGELDDDGPRTLQAHRAMAATSRIVDQIVDLRATTLDGILVKVRGALWCRGGDPFSTDTPGSTEEAAVTGLLTDLLAMVPAGMSA